MKKGIIFAIITAVISGFSIFYNKLIIVKGIDPLIFNIIKNGGVALILSCFLLTITERKKIFTLKPSQWKKLLAIGFIGGFLPFVLYFEGLKSVAPTNANLIHKTLFIWVAMMAVPILKEKLSILQTAGYLIVAWSNLFIGGLTDFSGNSGEIMILAATILWSVENIIAKIALKDIESGIVTWGRMFIGSIFMILLAITQNKLILITRLNPSQVLPIGGSVLLLTGYVYFWFKALKFAPATFVTSVLILATPITNILSAIFITHNLPKMQLINIVTTFIGLLFITLLTPIVRNLKSQMLDLKSKS